MTFLLFVPLGDKRCGLLVPLKALKSKMKCDGNYFFSNKLIFCFLLHIEKPTDGPGPRHFQEGVLLEFHREASVSFFYLLSIILTYLATGNISLVYDFFFKLFVLAVLILIWLVSILCFYDNANANKRKNNLRNFDNVWKKFRLKMD